MNKTVLKKFAIESRQDLMEKIKNKIKTFYVDEDFSLEQNGDIYVLSNNEHSLSLSKEEVDKRNLLIKRIKELSLEQVIEEASYTWFNRIIAIRYMEINDMLPLTKDNQSLGIRVLSSKDNTPDPEIMKFTNLINPDLDINFRKEIYAELKNDNDKFKYILLLICKKLGKVIPQVFDGITDYIDILIPDNLLNDTGFITKVIKDVPEENYNQVEIIGWLYQYYNQIEKDRVISAKKTYKKNEIPYATQLFTPDWIVKYMVENSLGKYWIEHNGDMPSLTENWKYFIKENIELQNNKLNPTEITFIDPCCGSGHILVYAFEVFYQIYLKSGYNKSDIPELILKNNLYGLDIDDRAGQLSILSVLLKAREYDKNIFNKEIVRDLHIMSIQESNTISEDIVNNISNSDAKEQLIYLLESFQNAKEIGSLLVLEKMDYDTVEKVLINDATVFGDNLREKFLPLTKVANILTKKYDIVATNPPYLNNGVMSDNLKKYLGQYYNDSKTDLCTAFMSINILKNNGYYGIINQHSWMFLSSFAKMREKFIHEKYIINMIHLGARAFEEIGGEVVQTTAFVFTNTPANNASLFYRLVDLDNASLKETEFLKNKDKYKFIFNQSNFRKIPGNPIGYWLSDKVFEAFKIGISLDKLGILTNGMFTCDNNRFLRKWYEVSNKNIFYDCSNEEESKASNLKWYPYNKGGDFRKWYGNHFYVINFEHFGSEISIFRKEKGQSASFPGQSKYFQEGISWSLVSNYKFGARFYPNGFVFDIAGSSCFPKENFKYILGFLTSNVAITLLNILNPTMNFQIGDVSKMPLIYDEKFKNRIEELVDNCINLSKNDWDDFETSWNFKKLGIVNKKSSNLISANVYNEINRKKEEFNLEIKYEEELNDIFIKIYSLTEEKSITKRVMDRDVSVRIPSQEQLIKDFISYAVGCMFGRYSLDEDGLIYAGGDFDINRYKLFKPDVDNVIPITDQAYFGDDIVERFKEFVKVVYGKETFNENLDFIAETLGKKGTETSEDTIRRYFLNDFYNDHVKTYQKRPIYWLFDSGKKNGFKALIYMHRYNENLVPKVRLDYLHRIQTTYEKLLSDVNYRLTTDLSMTDKKIAENRKADLNAKLQEIKEYDEKIAHIANQRISIDLDDGVKENYEKFKDILVKIK